MGRIIEAFFIRTKVILFLNVISIPLTWEMAY